MARTKQMRKGKKIAPQDEATRQARDQFIRDMAAKALANPPIVADSGGIHPSRLARTNGNSKGPLNRGAKKQQANKHSQVQGPPEVRKSGNKRNFEDSDAQNSAPSTASKKQRTKGEPKGPKAPAAVKSESIKGNQRALTEEQKSVVEAEETAKLIKLADKAAQDTTAKEEAKRARKAAKKAAKKPIKDAASDQESTVSTRKNVSESEESIRQMTKEEEKAARKRAKKDAKARKIINEAESREATMQEGLEELKGYELKSEEASAQTGSGPSERVTSGQKLATMTLEEEREARRQKSSELRAIKAARKAKKAQAQAQAAAASDAVDAKVNQHHRDRFRRHPADYGCRNRSKKRNLLPRLR